MNVRHLGEQDLGKALCDDTVRVVPTGPVHEEAVHEATDVRSLEVLRRGFLHLKVPDEGVNLDFELPSVVLELACQEGLCEVKARDPEGVADAFVNPIPKNFNRAARSAT